MAERLGNIIKVLVHTKPITKLKIDAITDITDNSLQNVSQISKSITKAAGAEYIEQWTNTIQTRHQLEVGEVIKLFGWQLPCKFVLKAISPGSEEIHIDQRQTPQSMSKLQTMFEHIINYGTAIGLRSLAFCTRCTGL